MRADVISRSPTGDNGAGLSVGDKPLSHIDLAVILDEYASLHREVQNMCNEKLEVGSSSSSETHVGGSCDESAQLNHAEVTSHAADQNRSVDGTSAADQDGRPTAGSDETTCQESDAGRGIDTKTGSSSPACDVAPITSAKTERSTNGEFEGVERVISTELQSDSAAGVKGCGGDSKTGDNGPEHTLVNDCVSSPVKTTVPMETDDACGLASKSSSQVPAVVLENDVLQVSLSVSY